MILCLDLNDIMSHAHILCQLSKLNLGKNASLAMGVVAFCIMYTRWGREIWSSKKQSEI